MPQVGTGGTADGPQGAGPAKGQTADSRGEHLRQVHVEDRPEHAQREPHDEEEDHRHDVPDGGGPCGDECQHEAQQAGDAHPQERRDPAFDPGDG